MLTRETKAGLVVAGSFLCLIVVVVIARLRPDGAGPTEPGNSPEQAAASAKTEPVQIVPVLQQPPEQGGSLLTQTGGAGMEPPPEPPELPAATVPLEARPVGPIAPPPFVGPMLPDNLANREIVPAPEAPVVPPPDVPPPPKERGAAGANRPVLEPPPLVPPGTPDSGPSPAAPAAPTPTALVVPPGPTDRPMSMPAPSAPPSAEPTRPAPRPAPGAEPDARPTAPAGREQPISPAGVPPAPPTDARPPAAPPPPRHPLRVPEVDSWNEDIYIWKANDTFRTVSQAWYEGTDVYARALFEFNRVHPQGAEGLRAEPPVIRPGEKLFIPPIRILEKDHPALVPERGAIPAAPVAATPPGDVAPSYRVGRDGEMFLDVARRTGVKWEDIYLLNRQHDPKQPIPAGVLLQLPAGARVPAENRPSGMTNDE